MLTSVCESFTGSYWFPEKRKPKYPRFFASSSCLCYSRSFFLNSFNSASTALLCSSRSAKRVSYIYWSSSYYFGLMHAEDSTY